MVRAIGRFENSRVREMGIPRITVKLQIQKRCLFLVNDIKNENYRENIFNEKFNFFSSFLLSPLIS